jgi:hypothetical protein
VTNENDVGIGFHHAETGEIMMLNKKERTLVKALLGMTLSSELTREVIREKFGEEYIEVALRLLRTVSGGKM